jgi:hypothetical protein
MKCFRALEGHNQSLAAAEPRYHPYMLNVLVLFIIEKAKRKPENVIL